MVHHTKDKGDLGVAKAYADLVGKGYVVLTPMSEHTPFDLVAYKHGVFVRVQVKFRTMNSTGALEVEFKSGWSDRHGSHKRLIDKCEVDVYCLYCPDTDTCYYLRPQDHGTCVTLRITPSRSNQRAGVWFASEFLEVPEVTPS